MRKAWIHILFLRFYAANLARKRRNDPAIACSDAVNQLAAVSGTPIVLIFMYTFLLVWRQGLQHLYSLDRVFLGIVLPIFFGVVFWLKGTFSKYADSPQAADPYRLPGAVWATNLLFFAVPVLSAVFTGLLLHVVDPP